MSPCSPLTRISTLAAGCLALSGCDPVWSLDIYVTVPEGARVAAGGYPQAVLVTMSDPAGETIYPDVAFVICDPAAGDLPAESRMRAIGRSGHRDTLTAWLQELPPEHRGLRCGWRKYVEGLSPFPIPPGAWRASEVVFEHEDGHDSAHLVLTPP
jgi:hypothetical protein